ncbi:MAG: DUF6146 family protein [bacterium]
MKTHIFLVLTIGFILIWGCTLQQHSPDDSSVEAKEDGVQVEDSLEYDLVIFDSEFNRWFTQQARPISFYDHQYLRRWNTTLAREWNSLGAASSVSDCRPVNYLDYDSDIEYDKKLDYKLFYYFRYMHLKCRIFSQTPGQWR